MTPLIASLLSALIVALISIIGIITFALSDKLVKKILIMLVSFSAGSLIGGAFFHLLPESIEKSEELLVVFGYVLIGFSLFFILERVLRWHHCHDMECETHQYLGHINLFGDAVHNILDGIIIFSSFAVSPALGIPVTLSIIFHEAPQEISDFGVLLYAGFKKSKALLYNFLAASGVVLGVFLGYLLMGRIEDLNQFLLPFAAGSFIYIAASDLVPEIHQERSLGKSLISFFVFLLALLFMLLLKVIGE